LTDNGAAMLAEETRNGLSRLGIAHKTTLPYSPYHYVALKNMWPQTTRPL
jgi:transposase InsO family protein